MRVQKIHQGKLEHLPVLESENFGIADSVTGYPNRMPVEVGELIFGEKEQHRGYSSRTINTIPPRRNVVYVLGRSEDGDIITSGDVDHETRLAPVGEVLVNVLDYNRISDYL